MDRTKLGLMLYVLGLVGPILAMELSEFLYHTVGRRLPGGKGRDFLISFGICLLGVILQRAAVGRKLLLIGVAIIGMPLAALAYVLLLTTIDSVAGTRLVTY